MKSENEEFMLEAIRLAKLGEGKTNPNPLVGAVIVKDGKIIASGYHRKYGELHAERDALKNAAENNTNVHGAEIYVTLEPCCHFGKQPPCTQAIIEAGISKVIVGSRDPNPLVHGKGIQELRKNGIEVTEDFLREKCDALNEIFFHFITKNTPYVAIKYAMTLDGKIATHTGKSKWITNEKSRTYVHELRNKYSAILCGIGTVLADDPLLTCRIPGGRNPVRVIVDSHLRIPFTSNIVQTAKDVKTIIVCCSQTEEEIEKKAYLEKFGAEILVLQDKAKNSENTHVNLRVLMAELGKRKIDSVLIEGGGEINFSALQNKIVNKVYCFAAPKIFGGNESKSPVEGLGINETKEAFSLSLKNIQQFDEDLLLEYDVLEHDVNL